MECTNLKWVTWRGKLPDNAVSIYNEYAKRTDYVAKHDGKGGFYTPDKGPYCYYPYADKEHRASQFEILVNEGNLENLEWKGGSWGSVPPNSVETSSGEKIYVGKNQYGLGKVHVKNKAFFLPCDGKETFYKNYEVLTYDTDISSQEISNVVYNINKMKIVKLSPEVIDTYSVDNNECRQIEETVTLQRTLQVMKRWDSSTTTKFGGSTSITATIPSFGSFGIGFSSEKTWQLSQGTTVTETKSHSLSVKVTVPPNHSCSVRMLGNRSSAEIPFTAYAIRKYRCGKTASGSITGTYRGVDTYDVRSVVERCTPIPNARPCPK